MLMRTMEISQGLQEEIQLVQNKLTNAIRDHQIFVGKLKDEPNNEAVIQRIEGIQLQIVSLGRFQKEVVQRLRKEVEAHKADSVSSKKVSLTTLLGLNNNNHITTDNEKELTVDEIKEISNGFRRAQRLSEDNYDVISNCNLGNGSTKERSSSIETLSSEGDSSSLIDFKSEIGQVHFLSNFGLITLAKLNELRTKRVERKRKSTANSQFVYSKWDLPKKRERHAYLQSAGNVPQTRQTKARLNDPSLPLSKPQNLSFSVNKTVSKSIIPAQKFNIKSNILQNTQESQLLTNDKIQLENGTDQVLQVSETCVKIESCSEPINISELTTSSTIKRIKRDTVCIHCSNSGTLCTCDFCSASYHVSCHAISPPPLRVCPKCAVPMQEDHRSTTPSVEKVEEFEEKERERYELRERNSDLRLQVHELEKRSQLLGQSLQLQQCTRQELMGKQEKTQKSIKRIIDFVKLFQSHQKPHLATTSSKNCHLFLPSVQRPSHNIQTLCSRESPINLIQQPPTHSSSIILPISIKASPTSSQSPISPSCPVQVPSHSMEHPISFSNNSQLLTLSRRRPSQVTAETDHPKLYQTLLKPTSSGEKQNQSELSQDSIPSMPLVISVSKTHLTVSRKSKISTTNINHTTNCSQAIISPISSPVVWTDRPVISKGTPLSIVLPNDGQKTEPPITDQDSLCPTSPT